MKRLIILCLSINLFSGSAIAQKRFYRQPRTRPTLTYDLGVAFGSYNNDSYTEITLGFNYKLLENILWRNAAFSRMGNVENIFGVDTSLRYVHDTDGMGGPSFHFFAGPGYRISNEKNSGPLIEGGVVMKSGGLSVGGGFKSVFYNNPGKKSDGTELPKRDTILFVILGAGGAF